MRWNITRDTVQLTGDPMVDPDNPNAPTTVGNRDNVVKPANASQIPDDGFATNSHPKLKFNFTMQIVLRVPVGFDLVLGSDRMRSMDIPLKSVTRPQPTIAMTPINYYNYRTQVATKVDYGSATVVMYDDGDGKALSIYDTYMRTISPIANTSADSLINNPQSVPFGEMSSLGSLPNNPNGIIKSLSVFHHYISRGEDRVVEYKYINPKVQSFDLDELSMSVSDVTSVGMTFVYDGVVVVRPGPTEYDEPSQGFNNGIGGNRNGNPFGTPGIV